MQEVLLNILLWNEDLTEISYAYQYTGVIAFDYLHVILTSYTGVSNEPKFIRVRMEDVVLSSKKYSILPVYELSVPSYLGLRDSRISVRCGFSPIIMKAIENACKM